MKRIAVAVLLLSGCGAKETTVSVQEPVASTEKVWKVTLEGSLIPTEVRLIEIDGCEYLANVVHSGIALAHKGNCKYCLERGKK